MNADQAKDQSTKLMIPKMRGHPIVLTGLLAISLATTATGPVLAGTFSNTGNMNVARFGQNAWLLANGEVLVLGEANSLAKFECFAHGSNNDLALEWPGAGRRWHHAQHTRS